MQYGPVLGQYQWGLLSKPNCSICPFKNDRKCLPDGPVPARIAFVGESPGSTEIQEQRGFVGQSGQLLWMLAEEVGIDRKDVWVTNAMLCRPRSVKLSNGAKFTKDQAMSIATAACRERLIRELQLVQPRVIVPLGNWALWSLSDIAKAKIYAYRGARIDIDLDQLAAKICSGTQRSFQRPVKE